MLQTKHFHNWKANENIDLNRSKVEAAEERSGITSVQPNWSHSN